MAATVTRCARRAKRHFTARSSSLKKEKQKAHRANRRLVRQYTAALVGGCLRQAAKLEGQIDRPRLTGWKVS